MGDSSDILRALARFSAEAVAEVLWPTRCALCDAPGQTLCDKCRRELPYLDRWRACARCGAAYGRVQCDMCNPVSLGRIGRENLPFAACASATMFGEEAGRIVRTYKDQGERRLAADMASCMEHVVDPRWEIDAVTFVPATKAAMRYRGFDHGELLAREVARRLGATCNGLLERPSTKDQRALSANDRIANLHGSFKARSDIVVGDRLLLVDDVFTTGATLCAATDALLTAGAVCVRCLTFARV